MADTALSLTSSGTDSFQVGATINQMFTAFSKAPLQLLLIAGVPALLHLPAYLKQMSIMTAVFRHSGDPQAMAMAAQSAGGGFLASLVSFAGSILSIIAIGALISGSFQLMSGEKPQLSSWMRSGLSRFWAIIGASILVSLGAGLGMALLIVPGVILALMWSAAIPSCVIERQGPIKCLGRSASLTKGHRWALLGLFVLVVIVALILYGVVFGLLFLTHSPTAMAIGLLFVATVGMTFGSLLQASVFRNLRLAKEGIGTEEVVAVFE